MEEANNYNLIVVLGPTATGKTRFAALLADKLEAEIISADSRQVYKKMDLGTGKDYEDYFVDGKKIPAHLIDIHEAGYKYNVFEYQKDFFTAFEEIRSSGKPVILCGGTGMYIEAVTKGYQLIQVPVNASLRDNLKDKSLNELEELLKTYKTLHNRSDTDTVKRAVRAIEIAEYYQANDIKEQRLPEIKPIYFGISVDRETRRQRITKRLKIRLKEGMIEEVQHLLDNNIPPSDLIYYGLEYKFVTEYLTGQLDFDTMQERLNTAIHQFAKRQMTWFRKMEREGIKINWIDGLLPPEERLQEALQILREINLQ